jgi:hypothetical protein
VDDAVAVGVLQGLADLVGDGEGLGEAQAAVGRASDQTFQVAAGHELEDEVGLPTLA